LGLVYNPNPKHFQKVSIVLGPASQPDPTEYLTVDTECLTMDDIVAPHSNTLLGLAGRQDPTLLALFENILGLTCQPNPTALGPATKARPSGFC